MLLQWWTTHIHACVLWILWLVYPKYILSCCCYTYTVNIIHLWKKSQPYNNLFQHGDCVGLHLPHTGHPHVSRVSIHPSFLFHVILSECKFVQQNLRYFFICKTFCSTIHDISHHLFQTSSSYHISLFLPPRPFNIFSKTIKTNIEKKTAKKIWHYAIKDIFIT